jgi:hypothetical protein
MTADDNSQIVNLRNVIEVSKKDFGPMTTMPTIRMPRIGEEREDEHSEYGGKRPRIE